jgi:glutamine phosphoribosylpyrophosphate amidotransferase
VLLRDITANGLKRGDLGTVVSIFDDGKGYAVEFVSLTGETVALTVLNASDIREIREGEMARVRDVA